MFNEGSAAAVAAGIRHVQWALESPQTFADEHKEKELRAIVEGVRDGASLRLYLTATQQASRRGRGWRGRAGGGRRMRACVRVCVTRGRRRRRAQYINFHVAGVLSPRVGGGGGPAGSARAPAPAGAAPPAPGGDGPAGGSGGGGGGGGADYAAQARKTDVSGVAAVRTRRMPRRAAP